ncbi:8-oxo-dGTP pyrophosphatase MutT (NUDIX family) [Kribbella aluminosa]|uniref:8-oxo-dGTP pyrophosphatase MutT (NUDIX family) n=1 Tax=Kribbella aluminosa TaxID=416017 RepID=A0ABS4UHH5_9ACTN|nr:GNAT family N-acetyltransferase [Kribbella aluminosa]MBP2351074.1 8-oxo-dGTP pyrophosphatase MutT (NUDIX family) [Kribbella aluminosa]
MTAVHPLSDAELTLRPSQPNGQLVTFDVERSDVEPSEPVGTVEVRQTGPGVGLVTWALDGGIGVAERTVRLVAEYAFGELGLERLQVEVDPDLHSSARIAIRSGFRREGVLRGAVLVEGQRRDVAIYGMRADDPRPDTVTGWTALMDSTLPKKRVIAHVVVRDTAGRVLLCQVSYKKDLELPGGVVEPDEDPATGASRELEEELGTALPLLGVLAIDWLPRWEGWGDAVEILYDGGIHDPSLIDRLQPDGFEIKAISWRAPDELAGLVSPLNARRLPMLLAAPDQLHNLSNGSPITS